MRKLAVLICGFVSACNYDTGECFLRDEGGEGVGGGVITPGAGGFGEAPPEPQGAPAPANPCSRTAECTVTWKAGSDVCEGRGTAGSCTTLLQCQVMTLDEAIAYCEKVNGVGTDAGAQSCGPCQWATSATDDPVEKCKKRCDEENLDCIANCPKGNQSCMDQCNQKNGKCLKDCEK